MPSPKLAVDTMYIQWLSGLSIRRVAKYHNIGRMAVYGAFVKAYGVDCCNLRKQSLARVIYKEYGDISLAMTARGIEGLFRSPKTEDNYSRIQSIGYNPPERYDRLCHSGDYSARCLESKSYTPETYLNLCHYIEVSRITTKLVYLTMMSRMNRMTNLT